MKRLLLSAAVMLLSQAATAAQFDCSLSLRIPNDKTLKIELYGDDFGGKEEIINTDFELAGVKMNFRTIFFADINYLSVQLTKPGSELVFLDLEGRVKDSEERLALAFSPQAITSEADHAFLSCTRR